MSQRRRSQRQQESRQAPPFEITEGSDYRSIYVSGVFGGLNPNDANIIFYLDRMVPEVVPGGRPGELRIEKVNRELQIEVHMSPAQFKSISAWMVRHIQSFEERFGQITEEDEEQPAVV